MAMYDLGGTIKVEMLLHSFLKAEEATLKTGNVIGIRHVVVSMHIGIRMLLVVILDNMKATFVHVEVDIASLEIRGAGFPHKCIRVILLYSSPYRLTYAFTLYSVFHVQEIQVMMMCFWINLNNRTADEDISLYGTVSDAPGFIKRSADVALRENLSGNMSKLCFCAFLKSLLHVTLELRQVRFLYNL